MFFKGIADLYKIWSENQSIKKEEKEKAFTLIRVALQETKIYVVTLEEGNEKDKEKEIHLSNLWSEASQYARKIDPDLARRLQIKGNNWLDSEGMTIDQAIDAGIRLERIDAELAEALEYLP